MTNFDELLAEMVNPESQKEIPVTDFLSAKVPPAPTSITLFRGIKVHATRAALDLFDNPVDLVKSVVNLGSIGRHWSDQTRYPESFSDWGDKSGYGACECAECNSTSMYGKKTYFTISGYDPDGDYLDVDVCLRDGCDCDDDPDTVIENHPYFEAQILNKAKLYGWKGGDKGASIAEKAKQGKMRLSIIFEAEVEFDKIIDRDSDEGRQYASEYAVYDYSQEHEITIRHGSIVNIKAVRVQGRHMDEVTVEAPFKAVV